MNEDTNRIDPPEHEDEGDIETDICPSCHGEGYDKDTGKRCTGCHGLGIR